MNDKVAELNREYWGRIHDMCAGTKVKPWECVRFNHPIMQSPRGFHGHPLFDQFSYEHTFEFAVYVLEDRPLWIGSKLYHKLPSDLTESVVTDHDSVSVKFDDGWWCLKGNLSKYFTWIPPAPKRFTLNGVDLPCPVARYTYGFYIDDDSFHFESRDDALQVKKEIIKLLIEARDK